MPAGAETQPRPAPLLCLKGLTKSYAGQPAVRPTSLTVEAGDFCALLGPSGCGKSTLLRMIAGFVMPDAGRILIDGQDLTHADPAERPTNMVFQGYGLFPHLSVAENIAFGLKLKRRPAAEIASRTAEALALVRLEGFGNRGIEHLSGGQQQRVALARALILRPKILLLDEPLAALDLKLRVAMQEELRRIHQQIGGTFIFVTHDQGEAFALANRISVMQAGQILQTGAPDEIYLNPANVFVAGFVGDANLIAATRRSHQVRLPFGPQIPSRGADGPVTVMLRPESLIRLSAAEPSGPMIRLEAILESCLFQGHGLMLTVRLADGSSLSLRESDVGLRHGLQPGLRLMIGFDPAACRVLEAAEPMPPAAAETTEAGP